MNEDKENKEKNIKVEKKKKQEKNEEGVKLKGKVPVYTKINSFLI